MKLEVGQASDGTWYYRCRVNGRITAHGADYNSKAGAKRALVNHLIAAFNLVGPITDKVTGNTDYWMSWDSIVLRETRQTILKQIIYVN